MKAWITLADFAQVFAGKLSVVGGGVQTVRPPGQFGIAIEIVVPWVQRSKPIPFRINIVDAEKKPVTVPSPVGGASLPFEADGQVAVNPAPGVIEAMDLTAVIALNIVGFPVAIGQSYTIQLFLANEEAPAATKTFAVNNF